MPERTLSESSDRVRSVSWDDPRVSRRDAEAISGLDYLRSILEGRTGPPPVARLLGYRLVAVESGRTTFALETGEHLFNPFSTVHGGVLATLLDSAMAAAALSTVAVGLGCSTVEMKVNYVRPVTVGVRAVRCEASVLHLGTTLATAEGKVLGDDGKLYAHGVATCAIFPARRQQG
jgi:uncharacterized protein (TIGR00369 family)